MVGNFNLCMVHANGKVLVFRAEGQIGNWLSAENCHGVAGCLGRTDRRPSGV
jgi:hypothetical protein